MTRQQAAASTRGPALVHFRKVTRSYWPGLFHCYNLPDLPRTNNDLEQFFGAYRSHDRRTTGRNTVSIRLLYIDSLLGMCDRLHKVWKARQRLEGSL